MHIPEYVSPTFKEVVNIYNKSVVAVNAAQEQFKKDRNALYDMLHEHPPASIRLQESYQKEDGTYTPPHWDKVCTYETQTIIDCDELDVLIINENNWMESSCDQHDVPLYRRVIEVVW